MSDSVDRESHGAGEEEGGLEKVKREGEQEEGHCISRINIVEKVDISMIVEVYQLTTVV